MPDKLHRFLECHQACTRGRQWVTRGKYRSLHTAWDGSYPLGWRGGIWRQWFAFRVLEHLDVYQKPPESQGPEYGDLYLQWRLAAANDDEHPEAFKEAVLAAWRKVRVS